MVGLKENQKELKRVLSEEIARSEPIYRTRQESEKQSGRLETRQYEVYAAEKVEKAKRGKKSGIKIAIKVERESIEPGTGKRSVETSLYLSNESEKLPEVCHAIRKHWQVEVTNNLRDTTLAEDKLCVKETTVNRVMAGVRTLALGLLRLTNGANKKAQLDKFADNFGYLVCWLKSIHFL